ncbi:MAG: (2Fe-2S)-binding protein [Romboutsia sp.]
MLNREKCCSNGDNNDGVIIGEYVCYCNHVTEYDIKDAIIQGAETVQDVIKKTGAMKDSNCAMNNPKGTCCYCDIVYVFNKYKDC